MSGDREGREGPASVRAPAGADGATSRQRDPTPVQFVQAAGGASLQWTVVEMDARSVPGGQGAWCLVFARQDCIRRVWNYPADWRSLDDEALAALSWRR